MTDQLTSVPGWPSGRMKSVLVHSPSQYAGNIVSRHACLVSPFFCCLCRRESDEESLPSTKYSPYRLRLSSCIGRVFSTQLPDHFYIRIHLTQPSYGVLLADQQTDLQYVSCAQAILDQPTAIAKQHMLTYGLKRSPTLAALQNVPSGLP